MRNEQSAQQGTAEIYEQHHYEFVELLGRLSAQGAANYRIERPRRPEHVGKQEELIAMLQAVLEFARLDV